MFMYEIDKSQKISRNRGNQWKKTHSTHAFLKNPKDCSTVIVLHLK